MGLDMYLAKKTYVKNWDHMSDDQKHTITITKGGEPTGIDVNRISYIEEHVMYWRKANQIHAWFVETVQKGVDDCGTYYVEVGQLEELLDLCKEVLERADIVEGQPVQNGATLTAKENEWDEDPEWVPNFVEGRALLNGSEIAELLPTASGFFFGGTDYDEWYIRDIEDTLKGLTEILAEDEKGYGEYYYHSSW